jgi:hypothetical protein
LGTRWFGFFGLRGWGADEFVVGLSIAGGLELLQFVESGFVGSLGSVDAALEALEGTAAVGEGVTQGGVLVGLKEV